jgi:hypothetical protein
MRSRKTRGIPARLEAGRRRFEHWRRTRKGHTRIPVSLWASCGTVSAPPWRHERRRAKALGFHSATRITLVTYGPPPEAAGPAWSRLPRERSSHLTRTGSEAFAPPGYLLPLRLASFRRLRLTTEGVMT